MGESHTMRPVRTIVLLLVVLSSTSLCTQISIDFCCKDGQVLSINRSPYLEGLGDIKTAKCITDEGREGQLSLEDDSLMVLDPSQTNGEERRVPVKIRKSGERNMDCIGEVSKTVLDLDRKGRFNPYQTRNYTIRSEGSNLPNWGNVILNGFPVCGDNWTSAEARVACRMLGYTHGSSEIFGNFGTNHGSEYAMNGVHCTGDEASLFKCRYQPTVDRFECGEFEAAGVMCWGYTGPSNYTLTVDGLLTNEWGQRFEAGSFCLATDPDLYYGRVRAVHCQTRRVIQTIVENYWYPLALKSQSDMDPDIIRESIYMRPGLFYPDESVYEHRLLVNMAEFDNVTWNNISATVDYKEFHDFILNCMRFLFELLDETNDGVIEAAIERKPFENIPFRIFEGLLTKLFTIFDLTKDSVLSFKDDLYPRNRQGPSLEELFGQPPIMWPHPVYKFYTRLDVDQNEELSLKEAKDFLERTFTILDTNSDCKIDIEEIVTLVTSLGMSQSYGLALETILVRYNKLANFLINETMRLADKDQDGKTTWDDIWTFDDWSWIEELRITAMHIGYPQIATALYLKGDNLLDRRNRYRPGFNEKLMEALLDLMEHSEYTSPPRGICTTLG